MQSKKREKHENCLNCMTNNINAQKNVNIITIKWLKCTKNITENHKGCHIDFCLEIIDNIVNEIKNFLFLILNFS